MKTGIGRPFIKVDSPDDAAECFFDIKNLNPKIEIIPAHILTPDGIYGGERKLVSMKEIIGDFTTEINAVKTELSADPVISVISNSDSHCHVLNRVGREFFQIETNKKGYEGIIDSIRNRKIISIAEFHPEEGKFYLSGHRKNKFGHEEDFFTYNLDEKCPFCKKEFVVGVNQRSRELNKLQNYFQTKPAGLYRNEVKRFFFHQIPLIEIIAFALNTKSVSSKKIIGIYENILKKFPNEASIFLKEINYVKNNLANVKNIPDEVKCAITNAKEDKFTFTPPGFDGVYGRLKIG